MKVRLEVAKSKANVKRVVLTRDTTIGRAPECNLRIASSQVSRKHCEVLVGEKGVFVRDLGSSNGTFVGEQRLEPYEDTPVPPGSTLSVGGVRFRVRYELADSLVDSGGSTVNVPRPDAGGEANDTVRDGEAEQAEVVEVEEEATPNFEVSDTYIPDENDVPIFDADFDDGFAAVADDEATVDSQIHDLDLNLDQDEEAEAVAEVEAEPEEKPKSKGLFGWGKKKGQKADQPAKSEEKPSEEVVAVVEAAEEAAPVPTEAAQGAADDVNFDFGEEETSAGESGNLADFLQNLD